MWIKTKNGSYANLNYVSYVSYDSNTKEWKIGENSGEGFWQAITEETAGRLVSLIEKDLV